MAEEQEGDTQNLLVTGAVSLNLFFIHVAAWAPDKGRECISQGSFKALEIAIVGSGMKVAASTSLTSFPLKAAISKQG